MVKKPTFVSPEADEHANSREETHDPAATRIFRDPADKRTDEQSKTAPNPTRILAPDNTPQETVPSPNDGPPPLPGSVDPGRTRLIQDPPVTGRILSEHAAADVTRPVASVSDGSAVSAEPAQATAPASKPVTPPTFVATSEPVSEPAPKTAAPMETPIETRAEPEPTLDPVVGWLVVVDGPGRGSSHAFGAGLQAIGRGVQNAIALDYGDEEITSEAHAYIAYDDQKKSFHLTHAGQKAFVRLNGELLLEATPIEHGAQLRIGGTTLRFAALCGADFDWSGS